MYIQHILNMDQLKKMIQHYLFQNKTKINLKWDTVIKYLSM